MSFISVLNLRLLYLAKLVVLVELKLGISYAPGPLVTEGRTK